MPSGAVLVDTGPLVALCNRRDAHHLRCVEASQTLPAPLVTVWPVLTEAMDLLAFSARAQEDLWEMFARGALALAALTEVDISRIRALMAKYRDLPMDLADAALVRVAERDRLRRIFSLDHQDFRLYRPLHCRMFSLLPHGWTP